MIDELIRSGLRIAETALVFGRVGIGWALGHRPPAPQLLRETFEQLGTTYIKLGQFIASTPAIFPSEYVEEFQKCLDRTPVIPSDEILRVLREELGEDLTGLFRRIDETPLASASIAQVHEAELLNGQVIVLKIQKPGVQDRILTDMHFLFVASRLAEWFVPEMKRSSLSAIVEDLQKTMAEECNFLAEAQNLRRFRSFLELFHVERITAPAVFDSITTRRVLAMERLYGVPLTDLDGIRRYSPDPEQTLVDALNTWFLSLMACDFFHADVHAGNLLVLTDGRVAFIDFGIVGRIGQDMWKGMEILLAAMTTRDYTGMADALIRIGAADGSVEIDAFASDLRRVFEGLQTMELQSFRSGSVDEDQVNHLVVAIAEAGRRNGLRFPREFALLLKQLLYFDRYIRLLAPGLNVMEDGRIVRSESGFKPTAFKAAEDPLRKA